MPMNMKMLHALALCALLCCSGAAYGSLSNNPVNKGTESTYGLPIAAGTTFSIADDSETTAYDHFTADQIFVYPANIASFSIGSTYRDGYGAWGSGGTETAPYYAIVSDPSVLSSSYAAKSDGVNRLVFHAPASNGGEVLTISTSGLMSGYDKVVLFDIEELSGTQKSKFDIYVNGTKHGEQELNAGASAHVSIALSAAEIQAAESIEVSILRANYNEGGDCVYALSDLYVAGQTYELIASYTDKDGSAELGSIATLSVVKRAAYDVTWQQRSTDGASWSDVGTGDSLEVNPLSPGLTYYRASAVNDAGETIYSNVINVRRNLSCNEASAEQAVFFEDFGTITAGEETRLCRTDMVTGYTCNEVIGSNVAEGQYAIVANSYYAGCDGNCETDRDHWFRDINDHTQGGEVEGAFGGMLLANGQTGGEVIFEQTIEATLCANTYVNFSAWYANADHHRPNVTYTDVNVELQVLDADRNPIEGASIVVDASIDEGWKRGEVSFYTGDNTNFILQILNYGTSGAGNDVLIDDIMFSYCTPLASLEASSDEPITISGDTATVKCGSAVTLTLDESAAQRIFANPYCLWLSASGEDGTYAIDEETSGAGSYSKSVTVEDFTKHKVIVAADENTAREYFAETIAECNFVAVSNELVLECTSIELSYVRSCNSISLTAVTEEAEIEWRSSEDGINWTSLGRGPAQRTEEISATTYFMAVDSRGDDARTDAVEFRSVSISANQSRIALGAAADLSVEAAGITAPIEVLIYKGDDLIASAEAQSLPYAYADESIYSTSAYRAEADDCVSQAIEVEVQWPTIFTPDGDGKNDAFADGLGIKLTVFDRYGNVMAEGSDGWDGRSLSGLQCMPGVYFYVAELPDGSTHKGTVEIAKFATEQNK